MPTVDVPLREVELRRGEVEVMLSGFVMFSGEVVFVALVLGKSVG